MNKQLEGTRGGFVSKIGTVVTSIKFLALLAIVIIAGTFVAWQYHNSTNPDRVFWGMVSNNLQTSSYTRYSYEKSGAQSNEQITSTATSPQNVLFAQTVYSQTGVDSARAVTENIGTPTEDYVRYTNIETQQKMDFKSVLGVWGKSRNSEDKTQGQLFNQAVLGVMPIGNLTASQRRELMKTMEEKGAYKYKLVSTTRDLPFYRPVHTVQVTVSPVGYITAMKQFAGYTGLNHLKDVNPEEYKDAQELSFMVSVDGWTHQMTQIEQSDGKKEVVSGHNLRKQLPGAPKDAISVEELQIRLQSLQ